MSLMLLSSKIAELHDKERQAEQKSSRFAWQADELVLGG